MILLEWLKDKFSDDKATLITKADIGVFPRTLASDKKADGRYFRKLSGAAESWDKADDLLAATHTVRYTGNNGSYCDVKTFGNVRTYEIYSGTLSGAGSWTNTGIVIGAEYRPKTILRFLWVGSSAASSPNFIQGTILTTGEVQYITIGIVPPTYCKTTVTEILDPPLVAHVLGIEGTLVYFPTPIQFSHGGNGNSGKRLDAIQPQRFANGERYIISMRCAVNSGGNFGINFKVGSGVAINYNIEGAIIDGSETLSCSNNVSSEIYLLGELVRKGAYVIDKTALTAEATARENADTALQANIETEETARKNADTELQTKLDNLLKDGWKAATGLANITRPTGNFVRLNNFKTDTLNSAGYYTNQYMKGNFVPLNANTTLIDPISYEVMIELSINGSVAGNVFRKCKTKGLPAGTYYLSCVRTVNYNDTYSLWADTDTGLNPSGTVFQKAAYEGNAAWGNSDTKNIQVFPPAGDTASPMAIAGDGTNVWKFVVA